MQSNPLQFVMIRELIFFSLSSIAASPSHCIRGSGPWQVVSDKPEDLRCDLEIALLFTSDEKTEYVLATDDDVSTIDLN